MTQPQAKLLRRIYGAVLSTVIIMAGICLMAACYGIYRSGQDPFSRQSVAQAFSGIAVPVYLCLVLVIGGFILALLLPEETKKAAPRRQTGLILQRLQAKTDLNGCDPELQKAVLAQRQRRKRSRILTAAALAVGSAVFLSYALNISHFTMEDINGSMVKAVALLLPCMAVPFGFAVYAVYSGRKSMETEITLLRQASSPAPAAAAEKAKVRHWPQLRYVILVLAVGLLILGYCTGGTADVLTKAINICTECVGLG